MNRIVVAIVGVMLLAACAKTPREEATNAGRDGRVLTHWKFLRSDPIGAQATDVNDLAWQSVTVPHTWNNKDGQDGGFDGKINYLRAACWYRRHLEVTPEMESKELFLKFEGANRRTDVFINGKSVGKHIGGYAAFIFDITPFVQPGDNILAVRVTNEHDDDSPPLSADFTFYGGLYRPVHLLVKERTHISPLDNGSPGVTIRTPTITDSEAHVLVRTLARSTLMSKMPVRVAAHVHIVDAQNEEVAKAETDGEIRGDQTTALDCKMVITDPHRWNGRIDPYLYTVTVDLVQDGKIVDTITQPLGIRTFALDKDKGFILNGKPYHLHGVNRHQDRPGKGTAISDADHDEDMALIKELGCTAIRLAHYQHAEHFYQLCDREGIVVWAELPVVNAITPGKPFADNAKQQLTELIRQNINHPSICFWSIANEVSTQRGDPVPLFKELNALAKSEDPTRITTMAFAVPKDNYTREYPGITDTFGQNRYSAWYRGKFEDIPPFLKSQGSIAISEYGAGASPFYHSETPRRQDHTEEYQCVFHEFYWPAIKAEPHVWGSFVWNMFDFAADQRKEGDHAGINDKGLVTFDRKTRKDAFYYYKANWTTEPMVWITSKRFAVRGQQRITVKVYSNLPELSLSVNGVPLGKKSGQNCVFVWDNVELRAGNNEVIAGATSGANSLLMDSCRWTYKPGAPTEVYVAQDDVMREELRKGPPQPAPDPSAPATQPGK